MAWQSVGVNPAAPFGISVSEEMLGATTTLLQSIGYAQTRGHGGADPADGAQTVFSAVGPTAGVGDIVVTATPLAVPQRIVRLAVRDPLGVWCAWHLDGVAAAESDVDQFLHDPAAGLIVRCNDANRYELIPLANDVLHNRAMFIETDPTMLTETVVTYCREFGFRPISAEPFHHHQQMTRLQRGGRYRMTLGLLTPNGTPTNTNSSRSAFKPSASNPESPKPESPNPRTADPSAPNQKAHQP